MRSCFVLMTTLWVVAAAAAANDSPWVYGIHWYGPLGSADVESMSGGKGIWDLEITLIDVSVTNPWDQPGYFAGTHCPNVTGAGKSHSMIFRVQPNWSRNVPYTGTPADPYTLGQYTADAQAAANTLKDYVHIWQIGNEVNLDGENTHWNGSAYNVLWQPTPAQYAAVYVALRDAIHTVTPTTTPANQIVLMQPNSPGTVIPGTRFMDGNEFLWRMIEAVPDKAKIDGFALHGYSDPATAGTDYGMEGFWDSITEQISIIDQWGLGDRPIFITEFNKHMPPNPTPPTDLNANIGARFLQAAYTKINAWNLGTGDLWPGQTNHNVVGATWFVYPSGLGWDDYSLLRWKSGVPSTDPNLNPWYAFQTSSAINYARGGYSTGPTIPLNTLRSSLWWQDDFNGTPGTPPDTTAPPPDWKVENGGNGTVQLSGTGALRFVGSASSPNSSGSIRTSGYAYGNFRLEADVVFTNVARPNTTNPEANFDLRVREGAKGYSLTFFTSGSTQNPNSIILRRTNDWTQIGSYNQSVAINNGDQFHVSLIADGSNLQYVVTKSGSPSPVLTWNVTDSGQVVGSIRLMTWNLQEAQVQTVQVGGPLWNPSAGVADWAVYW